MRSSVNPAIEAIRLVVPLAILGAAAAGAAWIGQKPPAVQKPQGDPEPVLVKTVPVELHDKGLDIEVDGSVVPYREVQLAAEVAGRVVYKAPNSKAGQFVRKGEVLYRIDPEYYQLEVQRLTEELEQASISIEQQDVEAQNTAEMIKLAEQELVLQERQLERMQRLSANRAASESERDQERRNQLSVQNNLLNWQNQLRIHETKRASLVKAKALVQARLDQAKLDLQRTEIRAPFDAVVVSDSVEMNEFVQKGTAVVTLDDVSAVEVRCNLRMEELRWVWEQQNVPDDTVTSLERGYELPKTPATILYRLNSVEYAWDAVLSRYDGIGLDEQTRTVPCRLFVDSPRNVRVLTEGATVGPPTLMRGMFVTVRLHVVPKTPLYRLPENAVRPGNLVWRVRDGKLDIVPVQVAKFGDDSALSAGTGSVLVPDDRMVVSPLAHVEQGMPVTEVLVR